MWTYFSHTREILIVLEVTKGSSLRKDSNSLISVQNLYISGIVFCGIVFPSILMKANQYWILKLKLKF